MTITETCSCGASIAVTDSSSSYAQSESRRWRTEHKHAESVGICGDEAPLVIPKGSDMPPMYCDLKSGHTGAHSDGSGHWIRDTHKPPADEPANLPGDSSAGPETQEAL